VSNETICKIDYCNLYKSLTFLNESLHFSGVFKSYKIFQNASNDLKSLGFFEKASILLKMYLKSFAILGKASILLEKFSKRIKTFIKTSHF
jgi:hypothetical protein